MFRAFFLGCAWVVCTIAAPIAFAAAEEGRAQAEPVLRAERAARGPESRPALAAPGRCAEPRRAVDARTGDGFSVVGPVAALFDPVDVAGGPAEGSGFLVARPTARPLVRPGACDQPGSGCRAAIETTRVVEPPPIDPNDPPPPGFGSASSRSR